MRRLVVFNNISLDGFFSSSNGDISWAKAHLNPEFKAFVEGNALSGGTLLFGRITYDLMQSYWPAPMARKNDPVVAERMNSLPKIVFSRNLNQASWNNTRLMKNDLAGEVRKLKQEPGPHIAILGSGTIVSQLAQEGLIDEYQFVLNPVVLGEGRTMFEGLHADLKLKLTSTRTFAGGVVFLRYEPA